MIITSGLSRTFKPWMSRQTVTAVHDLTLNIEQGELFGLVGPDGAGKTTLLRMLAGILKPTTGTASVNGHDCVTEAEDIKQNLGYMPQQFGLYPDLTVDENLHFICEVFNVSPIDRDERIRQLLDFTGLHAFRARRGHQLSGGMQKKLGLAAALVHRPTLLLLDEPTTGVDPVARREFWNILTQLHASGSTVIVSTPYMDEAERCSRVGLLYEGRMMVCDTPRAIKNLLPGKVFAVRTSDLLQAERILRKHPAVIDLQPYGDMIYVIVEVSLLAENLRAHLVEHITTDIDLRPAQPRLEEAFIYFVRQYSGKNRQSLKEVSV